MAAMTLGASDSDLLQVLYDEHAAALWAYVTGLLHGDRVRAQDVVQETLLRAWRNPAAVGGAGSSRGWLYTVARHIVIDDWRSARRHPEIITDALPEQAVEDVSERTADRALLMAALRMLSADHRRVLVECYFRGQSPAEAAALIGVPVGTVKSRLHYALHGLRAAIAELGGEQ